MAQSLPINPASFLGNQQQQPAPSQLLPADAKPPKSKLQPYYSIHSLWTDIVPIPQKDLESPVTFTSTQPHYSSSTAEKLASAGPPLAAIAYTPRYAEAMSYLRAVMAKNEYSERCLSLTEDVIGMNPAHYTVWIYRFKVLKVLWGLDGKGEESSANGGDLSERVKRGIDEELMWLERVSTKNLKNYQIWHHRTSIFTLLPNTNLSSSSSSSTYRTSTTTASSSLPSATAQWVLSILNEEPVFLRNILSLDTKNYHVWSYRQWLCARFASHFLFDETASLSSSSGTRPRDGNGELEEVSKMITEDVMNNSAWNHRWFLVYGHKEILRRQQRRQEQTSGEDAITVGTRTTAEVIDMDVFDRELTYVQSKISLLPQNGSSWNYLKGLLKYTSTSPVTIRDFVETFVGKGFDFSFFPSSPEQNVKSSQAIEMSVDIMVEIAAGGGDDQERAKEEAEENNQQNRKHWARDKARQGLTSLADHWDPIRKRYWMWRLGTLEDQWKIEDED